MPNDTTTPAGGDHVRPTTPGTPRDDPAAAEREARLAELTLERFTLCPARASRPAHRSERAVIRHLEQGARHAHRAAELARSGGAASRGPRHHGATELCEAER